MLSLSTAEGSHGWSDGEEEGTHVYRHELVDLDSEVGEHAETQALVAAAKPKIGEAARGTGEKAPGNMPYVGSSTCLACHPAQFAQWRTTDHSTAWATLVEIGRERDLDCFACHATGALDPRGPQHPAHLGALKNMGCESCHGPGEDHVANPGAGTMPKNVGRKICIGCHDGVKDEGQFEWESYLPRVVHQPVAEKTP